MAAAAVAALTNVILWGVAYLALSRRTSSSTVHFWVLAPVSAIGAAIMTSIFALPEPDYLVVVAAPLALTVVVVGRHASHGH
jgi:hypothetical protein